MRVSFNVGLYYENFMICFFFSSEVKYQEKVSIKPLIKYLKHDNPNSVIFEAYVEDKIKKKFLNKGPPPSISDFMGTVGVKFNKRNSAACSIS